MAEEQSPDKRIALGRKPPSASLAWWYLSREAKALLLQERLKGRFGGTPGKAPYWHSQEEGNTLANIEPLFYIQKALDRWQVSAGVKINRFIRGK